MNIFIVIIEDRHIDVEVKAFLGPDKAIETARALAKEYCRHPEDYKENDIEGYLFNAVYSCEDDSISVQRIELEGA